MLGDWHLERAIYDTVRFYSGLEMPVTKVQIWRCLVMPRDGSGQRWHGRQVPSLNEITKTLAGSAWLKQGIGSQWGYYWLRSAVAGGGGGEAGRQSAQRYVRERLIRHALAQQKWKITRRVVRWFNLVPLVIMVGGSGSLAWFNTRPTSDLDLLVVARRGRIWTARLLLLFISQLAGRRRKYWDEIAPDKICLNHYITDASLLMKRGVRNLYTAQQYAQLVPLIGLDAWREWWELNQTWMRQYVMYPPKQWVRSRLDVQSRGWRQKVKKLMENFFEELPGDYIEMIVRRIQVWVINQHDLKRKKIGSGGQHHRIMLSDDELAFHPNTKVPEILKKYYEEEGQRTLL